MKLPPRIMSLIIEKKPYRPAAYKRNIGDRLIVPYTTDKSHKVQETVGESRKWYAPAD